MATDLLPSIRIRYQELTFRNRQLSDHLQEIERTRKPILDEYRANAHELDLLEQYLALKDIPVEEIIHRNF